MVSYPPNAMVYYTDPRSPEPLVARAIEETLDGEFVMVEVLAWNKRLLAPVAAIDFTPLDVARRPSVREGAPMS